jgi:hypothetical protein
MVHVVLQDAINNVHSHMVSQNAFPTSLDVINITTIALMDAARARSPTSAVIHERLLLDIEYLEHMSIIVSIP